MAEIEAQQMRMARLKHILRNQYGVNVDLLPNDPRKLLVRFDVDPKRAMRDGWTWDEIEAVAEKWATPDPRRLEIAVPTGTAGGGDGDPAARRRGNRDLSDDEWSVEFTLKEIAAALTLPPSAARAEVLATYLGPDNLLRVSRQRWIVRLNTLPGDRAEALKDAEGEKRGADQHG